MNELFFYPSFRLGHRRFRPSSALPRIFPHLRHIRPSRLAIRFARPRGAQCGCSPCGMGRSFPPTLQQFPIYAEYMLNICRIYASSDINLIKL